MTDKTNLTETVAEAVREYVGDGDGADEEVLAAYEQQIRAQIAAEIEADHRAEAERMPEVSLEWDANDEDPPCIDFTCRCGHWRHLCHGPDWITEGPGQAPGVKCDKCGTAWSLYRVRVTAMIREEAEPDPLDENDHRDRVDRLGNTWQRVHEGCWMEPGFPPLIHGLVQCLPLKVLPGPLAFAPEAETDTPSGRAFTARDKDATDAVRAKQRPLVDDANYFADNKEEVRRQLREVLGAGLWSGWRRLRKDERDPLEEDDWGDRLGGKGSRWTRRASLWCKESCPCYEGSWELDQIDRFDGPLTFAPKPTQEAAEPLWCPECGHHIDDHHDGSCLTRCECTDLPSVIAQKLIRRAVEKAKQEAAGGDQSTSEDESGAVEGGGAPMPSTRRLTSCVERWPDCASGEYNPACCRFPKSCSPTAHPEDPRPERTTR